MISKRELLDLTNISYGQLYRWKRENLIPEDWFVKQSVPSGQETFFPKEKILSRISQILELKDKYSLDELCHILNPEISNKIFLLREIVSIDGIDLVVLNDFLEGETTATFSDIVLIYTFSQVKKQVHIPYDTLRGAMLAIKHGVHVKKINLAEYELDFIRHTNDTRKEEDYCFIAHKSNAILDPKIKVLKTYVFEDMINHIKEKGMN